MIAEILPFSLFSVGLLGILLTYLFLFKKPSSSSSTSETSNTKPLTETQEDESKPKMLILYGSQTGTAEEYSYTLAAEAQRYGFRAQVADMVEFDSPADTLPEVTLVILVVATYGEGEPTDNARDFYQWIKDESLPSDLLHGVNYAVFGLGNKQYKLYQAVARYFDKRMEELGATRAFEKGEGDADENQEEEFEDWKSRMLPELSDKFETKPETGEAKIEPKFAMKYFAETQTATTAILPFDTPKGVPDANMPFLSNVRVTKQLLTGVTDRSTLHLEFNIKGSRITYEAGDHLAVYPTNDDAIVKAYVERLGYGNDVLNKVFSLVPIKDKSKASYFPKKCTIGTAIKHHLDLLGLPKKKFLRVLALCASDPAEQEKLMLLSSNSEEGKAFYKSYIKEAGRTALEVLNDYPSVKLPVETFLEFSARLKPRYYSIASSSQMHPDSIHAVVSVVQFTTGLGKDRKGACSGFLESLKAGDQLYIYVRQSTFHLPRDSQKPVIMIGPGTGLAPFAGFLQQRRAALNKGQKLGEAMLFFGCRKRTEDYIYQTELEAAEKDGVITSLQVAFSRDQAAKVYVQHKVAEHREKIWSLLEKGANLYICGDAKYMAKDVDIALLEAIQTCGNKTAEEAAKYLDKLSSSNRYLRDVWSPNN